jgi:hypothetical protein
MATYKKGILGSFSGSVGPVVGSSFRGKKLMRSKPEKSTKPPTPKQAMQRAKFAAVIQFLNPVKEVLNTYYGTPEGTKSRYDSAVSYHLTEVLFLVDDVWNIQYNRAMYAKGTLLPAENLQCSSTGNHALKLTWNDNAAQAGCKTSDQLMVVVFAPEAKEYAFFMNAATRSGIEVTLSLSPQWSGKNVHVYGFMAAENGKENSGSLYLGEVVV